MTIKELIKYFKEYKKTYNEFPLPTAYQIEDEVINNVVQKLETYAELIQVIEEKYYDMCMTEGKDDISNA